MILHVAGLDKFIPPFVNLIKEEFTNAEHQFWFTGEFKKYPVEQSAAIYICQGGLWNKLRGYARLVWQLHSARKIMLHGLFNINVIFVLALCPWVLPKCYWVIWGGDLYQYTKASDRLGTRIKEALRRFVIRRIGNLVTYIAGDVELARQWYGAKGNHRECIMYLSNVIDPKMVGEVNPKVDNKRLNILLGNSANPSNKHTEAFKYLLPYKNHDIKIYTPLSYGDEKYANKIIAQGENWFGDKFIPMVDFVPFEEYLEFLRGIDIAIFNHQRQQAMGNIVMLLGMGKTVFMRSDVSHWRFLRILGVKVFDVSHFSIKSLGNDEANKNSNIVHMYFSKATLINQLSDIFED